MAKRSIARWVTKRKYYWFSKMLEKKNNKDQLIIPETLSYSKELAPKH